MAFIDKLRMQSIYGNGRNPFTPKESSPFNLLDQFRRRLPQEIFQPQIIPQPIEQPEPINTRMGYEIDPYKQALLGQREADRAAREEIARAQIGSREKIAGERETTRRDETAIKQKMAEVADFKARNPSAKIVVQRGGQIMAVHPITGEVIADLGSSGLMTEEEKQNLIGRQRIEQIEKGGEEARKTVAARGEEERKTVGVRGEETRKNIAARVTNRVLPSQEKVATFNRAEAVKAKYPNLAKHINLLPGNIVELTPASTAWYKGGPSKDEYDMLVKEIFGAKAPTTEYYTPKEEVKPTAKPEEKKTGDPLGIRK